MVNVHQVAEFHSMPPLWVVTVPSEFNLFHTGNIINHHINTCLQLERCKFSFWKPNVKMQCHFNNHLNKPSQFTMKCNFKKKTAIFNIHMTTLMCPMCKPIWFKLLIQQKCENNQHILNTSDRRHYLLLILIGCCLPFFAWFLYKVDHLWAFGCSLITEISECETQLSYKWIENACSSTLARSLPTGTHREVFMVVFINLLVHSFCKRNEYLNSAH